MNAKLTALKKTLSLLAPSTTICLTCGKHGLQSLQLPGICRICEATIPWIRFPRCLKCGRHVGCPDCTRRGESPPIECNRSAVAYNSVMREWLGQYKYRGNERYAPLLGHMLDRAYLSLQAENHKKLVEQKKRIRTLFNKKNSTSSSPWSADLLVSVPVSDSRLMERGFNQAERIASVLSQLRRIPQLPLLIRTHHTGKQSFKGRLERLTDMKHAFGANPEAEAQFKEWLTMNATLDRPFRVIIVDDIYTTGSTIRACAEILQQLFQKHGYAVEIYSLTWARS